MKFVLACGLITACASQIATPAEAPHPEDAYVVVPYPPPSALAEVIPERPHPDAVWVDGQWRWRGEYWVWDKGAWVLPGAGAKFAPWDTRYREDGTLVFAAPTWRDSRGRELREPRVLSRASTPPGERTPEPATTK